MALIGYVGSYASEKSKHVVRFSFDEERANFVDTTNILPWEDSKYMSLKGNDFLSVSKQHKAGVLWLHKDSGKTERLFLEDGTACFIEQDENYIYTANYHEGTLMIYAKKDSFRLYKRITIKEKAGCHQVLLQGRYVLVPCLLLDKIMIYDAEKEFSFVKELNFPSGSGPRHGVFDHHENFFIVSELSNQLFQFHVDSEMNFTLKNTMDLLENKEHKAAAAAIRMSKDERYLYISIREVNQIVVFDIEKQKLIQRIDSLGDHPRDIALSPSMAYLFVANRFTDNLVVFKRNQDSGMLTPCNSQAKAPEGVCIIFEQEETL